MDVLRCHVFQVNFVDAGTVVHIIAHPGPGHNIIQLLLRMPQQLLAVPGAAHQLPPRSPGPSQGVDLPYPLNHFKKPGPPRNAVGLQGRRHKADGFLRPALIRHHQICGHGIQLSLHALHRGVEGF